MNLNDLKSRSPHFRIIINVQTSEQRVLQQNETDIEIELRDIGFGVLLEAQQCMLAYVAKQKTFIETRATSNVCISHYNPLDNIIYLASYKSQTGGERW